MPTFSSVSHISFSVRDAEASARWWAALLELTEIDRVVGDGWRGILLMHPLSRTIITMWMLPRPKRVTTPLLVLGAEHDRCILQREVRAAARAYRTDAEIFPDMGHDMTLEPEWAAVAERIHTWLETHDPARKSLQSG
jgi:alpha-beta hydrolase superfamily lysophospholipase